MPEIKSVGVSLTPVHQAGGGFRKVGDELFMALNGEGHRFLPRNRRFIYSGRSL